MVSILRNIILFLLLLTATLANGQYSSQNGWFTVDQVKGCTGLTINITIEASKAPCSTCDFDYNGDGVYDPKSNPLTYTYTEPGNYTLEVLFPNPDGSDFINIEVTEDIAPEFSVYTCASENVIIDIQDANYDNYVINYDDGTQDTIPKGVADPRHAYPGSTPRNVTVRGLNNSAADNCAIASDEVVPITAFAAPAITTLVMIDNSSLELNYSLQPDVLYELQISPTGNGSYVFMKFIDAGDTQDTISGLTLDDRYVCFRIAARDPCSNTIASYSNEICSIDLDLSVESDVNRITWKTADPDVEFTLERDGLLTIPLNMTTRSYNDGDIVCNVEYCYTLISHYNNGYSSRSLPQCGTALSTTPPEPVVNISTVVNGNNIEVAWEEPAANITAYQIRKSKNGSEFTTSTENTYTDLNLTPDRQSYCYQIGAADSCGNSTAAGITACSVFLTGQVSRDNTITLSWNGYRGWENGVSEYRIEKSYPSGGAVESSTTDTLFQEIDTNPDEQVIRYSIVAVPNDVGLIPSVSNDITIVKPVNIFYPNAFTPDGNGTNDTFKLSGKFIISFNLHIFNRWGELIFVSNDMSESWDGTFNGKAAPEGTYIFNAEMQDQAGRTHRSEGSILLLRR